MIKRFSREYGSVYVLLILCAYYTVATWSEQHPVTQSAARDVAEAIVNEHGESARVLIIVRANPEQDLRFAEAASEALKARGATVVDVVAGDPRAARLAIEKVGASGQKLDAILTHHYAGQWGPLSSQQLDELAGEHPTLAGYACTRPTRTCGRIS